MINSGCLETPDVIQRRQQGGCNRFTADLERSFEARAPDVHVKTLDDILRSRRFHPAVELRLSDAAAVTEAPEASAACQRSQRVAPTCGPPSRC